MKENAVEGIEIIASLLQEIGRSDLSGKLRNLNGKSSCFKEDFKLDTYIDRQERQNISKLCESDSVTRIIAVIGGPAAGKTELIKSVYNEYNGNYKWLIESSDEDKFSDVLSQICCKINARTHHQSSQYDIILSRLRNYSGADLLILDISKTPAFPSFFNSVMKFLEDVLAVNDKLKIIISTRSEYDCIQHIKYLKKVPILYCKREFARNLVTKNGLIISPDNDSFEEVIDYCQGAPKVLLEYCNLIRNPGIEQGIKTIQVVLNFLKVDAAFKAQFESYARDVRNQLLQLSTIPGVFPCFVACSVLNLSDAGSAKAVLEIFCMMHLLQKSGVDYFMPCVIREYIKQLSGEDQSMKKTHESAIEKVIDLYIGILYDLNSEFMGLKHFPRNDITKDMLFHVGSKCGCWDEDKLACSCAVAKQVVNVYKNYKIAFLWILEHGIKGNQWRSVVDCANQCVSFLAKVLSLQENKHIYHTALEQSTKYDDLVRIACTQVSITFLHMYYNGCQAEYQYHINKLTEAEKVLKDCTHTCCDMKIEINEVRAHGLTKLAHLIGSNYKQRLKEALALLKKALEIRKKEIACKRGSKVFLAAAFVDIGNVYNHNGCYHEALENCTKALEIYKECVGEHPFTASTLSFIAVICEKINDIEASCQHMVIARAMDGKLLGHHLDTARFTKGICQIRLLKNRNCDVSQYIKVVYHMRKCFGYNERIQILEMYKNCCKSVPDIEKINAEILESKKKYYLETKKYDEVDCNHKIASLNGESPFKNFILATFQTLKNNRWIFTGSFPLNFLRLYQSFAQFRERKQAI